jgi:hypothetical protein
VSALQHCRQPRAVRRTRLLETCLECRADHTRLLYLFLRGSQSTIAPSLTYRRKRVRPLKRIEADFHRWVGRTSTFGSPLNVPSGSRSQSLRERHATSAFAVSHPEAARQLPAKASHRNTEFDDLSRADPVLTRRSRARRANSKKLPTHWVSGLIWLRGPATCFVELR